MPFLKIRKTQPDYIFFLGICLLLLSHFLLLHFYFSSAILNFKVYLVLPILLGCYLISRTLKYAKKWKVVMSVLLVSLLVLSVGAHSILLFIDLNWRNQTIQQRIHATPTQPYEFLIFQGEVFSAQQIDIEQRLEILPGLYFFDIIFSEPLATLQDRVTVEENRLTVPYESYRQITSQVINQIVIKKYIF